MRVQVFVAVQAYTPTVAVVLKKTFGIPAGAQVAGKALPQLTDRAIPALVCAATGVPESANRTNQDHLRKSIFNEPLAFFV